MSHAPTLMHGSMGPHTQETPQNLAALAVGTWWADTSLSCMSWTPLPRQYDRQDVLRRPPLPKPPACGSISTACMATR